MIQLTDINGRTHAIHPDAIEQGVEVLRGQLAQMG